MGKGSGTQGGSTTTVAGNSFMRSVFISYACVFVWITLSFSVIIFNKYILDRKMYNWPFPIRYSRMGNYNCNCHCNFDTLHAATGRLAFQTLRSIGEDYTEAGKQVINRTCHVQKFSVVGLRQLSHCITYRLVL